MKYDLPDLLEVFDELLPYSDEIELLYYFKYERQDGIKIRLSLSGLNNRVGIIAGPNQRTSFSAHSLINCLSIEVIDMARKIIEIKAGEEDRFIVRILLYLEGDNIVSCRYSEWDDLTPM